MDPPNEPPLNPSEDLFDDGFPQEVETSTLQDFNWSPYAQAEFFYRSREMAVTGEELKA